MKPDHDRIRERAYQIWRQEGCPEGRDQVHWQMALEQLVEEESRTGEGSGSGPMPDVAPPSVATSAPAARKRGATSRSTSKRNQPR